MVFEERNTVVTNFRLRTRVKERYTYYCTRTVCRLLLRLCVVLVQWMSTKIEKVHNSTVCLAWPMRVVEQCQLLTIVQNTSNHVITTFKLQGHRHDIILSQIFLLVRLNAHEKEPERILDYDVCKHQCTVGRGRP